MNPNEIPRGKQTPILAAHLDMKGVQFRPTYLPQLLADLAGQGLNAVLVEYEDVFPFQGVDIAGDPQTKWSSETLQSFLAEAAKHELEVIPLQQCLGHLEYVLQWDRYRPYALNDKYPSTIDINNPDAKGLVLAMLRQVIEAHPASRYIHIGMDEAHALTSYAEAHGDDVSRLFAEHVEELCSICESHGKTPIIFSDMLENYMSEATLHYLERLRDRVVICSWDYVSAPGTTTVVRLGGAHVSREWLDSPQDMAAPSLAAGSMFVDEMPAGLGEIAARYGDGKQVTSIFQADMWTAAGFRVLGTTASRVSADGPLLPYYNRREMNILAWTEAVQRTGQMGLIASSWARGTSWCPPNFSFDLTWPLLGTMTRALGAEPKPFFEGVEPATVDRLLRTLGRSREDWRRESAVAEEMEALSPQVTAHLYEWQSFILMARLLALHRRAAFAVLEVEDFWANHRPVDSEWQRRLDDQEILLADLATMRTAIVNHFSERYWGKALDEWVGTVFDVYADRLVRCGVACREKLAAAKKEYASR